MLIKCEFRKKRLLKTGCCGNVKFGDYLIQVSNIPKRFVDSLVAKTLIVLKLYIFRVCAGLNPPPPPPPLSKKPVTAW